MWTACIWQASAAIFAITHLVKRFSLARTLHSHCMHSDFRYHASCKAILADMHIAFTVWSDFASTLLAKRYSLLYASCTAILADSKRISLACTLQSDFRWHAFCKTIVADMHLRKRCSLYLLFNSVSARVLAATVAAAAEQQLSKQWVCIPLKAL